MTSVIWGTVITPHLQASAEPPYWFWKKFIYCVRHTGASPALHSSAFPSLILKAYPESRCLSPQVYISCLWGFCSAIYYPIPLTSPRSLFTLGRQVTKENHSFIYSNHWYSVGACDEKMSLFSGGISEYQPLWPPMARVLVKGSCSNRHLRDHRLGENISRLCIW